MYDASTGTPVCCGHTWNVPALTVSGSIGSLNATCTTALVGTLPNPFAGLTTVTDGGIRSAPAAVVNWNATGVAAWPARSFTAPTEMVCGVPGASGSTGVSTTRVSPLLKPVYLAIRGPAALHGMSGAVRRS